MSSEQGVPSPAAAVLARRQGRTTPQKRAQVQVSSGGESETGSETGSDVEGHADDDPLRDNGRDEDEGAGAGVRGRVRPHALVQVSSGLDDEDERRKALAEKGWARRSVVVHGVGASGGGNLEELPGREDFGEDEDGAQNWAVAALQFAEETFKDDGAEVRSMDQRDCKVGLFGDFCERVGHGKVVEWRANEEHGGLYELQVVKKVRAACFALHFASHVACGIAGDRG